MSSIDVDALLAELSADAPCGDDLEYDAEFGEMERATEAKPEQQFGDTIVPEEPPDWREVKKKALSLFKRTKDMRITAHLARAALATEGLQGFGDAIRLLRGLVDQYWEEVHPQLDPDDDNDPTFRINTLASLCDADSAHGTLKLLRDAPLVSSRMIGSFSLDQIHHAEEHPEGSGEGEDRTPSWTEVEAAFSDVAPEDLEATLNTVRQAQEDLQQLENATTERVGAGNATSLEPVVHVLKEMEKVLSRQMERRGLGAPPVEEEVEEASGDEPGGASAGGTVAAAPQRLTGEVTTREDAIRVLDKVCDYFEKHEPSSPLPLLIRRAQRLASKSFLEIIRDLAPDGIAQAEAIGGPVSEHGGGYEATSSGSSEESSSSDGW